MVLDNPEVVIDIVVSCGPGQPNEAVDLVHRAVSLDSATGL
jgi:hypothetical protein